MPNYPLHTAAERGLVLHVAAQHIRELPMEPFNSAIGPRGTPHFMARGHSDAHRASCESDALTVSGAVLVELKQAGASNAGDLSDPDDIEAVAAALNIKPGPVTRNVLFGVLEQPYDPIVESGAGPDPYRKLACEPECAQSPEIAGDFIESIADRIGAIADASAKDHGADLATSAELLGEWSKAYAAHGEPAAAQCCNELATSVQALADSFARMQRPHLKRPVQREDRPRGAVR